MTYSEPARTMYRTRIRWVRVAAVVVAFAGVAATLGRQLLASSPAATSSPVHVLRGKLHRLQGEDPGSPRDAGGALGEADGAVPDGTTVWDDAVPGVANLDPALLDALRRAATGAAGEGVELFVDSGWRSRAYQEHLLQEAVSRYGSLHEAARWVATPDTSAHVSGDAVDIGHADAAGWLSAHGAAYGLCQIYGNESWHYELRPDAVAQGCPPPYADPTQDPRMQK